MGGLCGRIAAIALATSLVLVVCSDALASASNKWRIQISGDAESDGVVVLQVAPTGEASVDVSVKIPDETGENRIARVVRDAMGAQLGDGYHVEVDDGEDVLVKVRRGTPGFDLRIKEKTVKGLRITLDRE